MDLHERYAHEILTEIEAGRPVSQRSLANNLGIALGLTNLLVRRLVRKGWIRIIRVKPNRVRYFLTPAGFAEKARMSRRVLKDAVGVYISARDRTRESLSRVARPDVPTRVVFFGTGELAEIAYVCLQETSLVLVGVVDEVDRGRFFGFTVQSPDDLQGRCLGSTPFDAIVVTSWEDEQTRSRLESLVPMDCVHWL